VFLGAGRDRRPTKMQFPVLNYRHNRRKCQRENGRPLPEQLPPLPRAGQYPAGALWMIYPVLYSQKIQGSI
jgi:hypothetical protein